MLQQEKCISNDVNKMKHLVIVPKSVITNWVNEFNHWCPSLRVFVGYSDIRDERIKKVSQISQKSGFDVCLTT